MIPAYDDDPPRQLLSNGGRVVHGPEGDITEVEYPIGGSNHSLPGGDQRGIMICNSLRPGLPPWTVGQDVLVPEMRVADDPLWNWDVLRRICGRRNCDHARATVGA